MWWSPDFWTINSHQHTHIGFLIRHSLEPKIFLKLPSNQWLFLVPVKGGRWHIITQLAIYSTCIPLIYCQLGGYMLPTTTRKLHWKKGSTSRFLKSMILWTTPRSTDIAGWKIHPEWTQYFLSKMGDILAMLGNTLKLRIAPENRPGPKGKGSSPNPHYLGATLVSGSVIIFQHVSWTPQQSWVSLPTWWRKSQTFPTEICSDGKILSCDFDEAAFFLLRLIDMSQR